MKGYRTLVILGLGLLMSVGLLVGNGLHPGMLSPFLEGLLEGVATTSATGLGLRFATTTPVGEKAPPNEGGDSN